MNSLIKPFLTFVLLTVPSFALADSKDETCKVAYITEDATIDKSQKLESGFTLKEVETLTARMCSSLVLADSGDFSDIAKEIENYILKFNGWDRTTPDYQSKVATFWNQHNEYFVCRNHRHRFLDQHFFQRVVEMQMYTPVLIEFMLSDETLYPFDVNVVENRTGKKQTVLDYLDSIIDETSRHDNYNMIEIRELREILVTWYDAKPASEVCP